MSSAPLVAQLVAAIAATRDPQAALEALLSGARRLTRAEAGTIYVRERDSLVFAVVQNDALARLHPGRDVAALVGSRPLPLNGSSIASYVAFSGAVVNVPHAYLIPATRPYTFDPAIDLRSGYRTRSILTFPLRDRRRPIFGVLQLINALNDAGTPMPFGENDEQLLTEVFDHIDMRRLERGQPAHDPWTSDVPRGADR